MIRSFLGTTNVDGKGNASNLSDINATQSVVGIDSSVQNGVTAEHASDANKSVSLYSDTWNKQGYKEAKVEGESQSVTISNFVDVDVTLTNNDGSTVVIENAKRGEVTTGDGADTIHISVYSNNPSWSNLFTIDSGSGNDHIVVTHSQNSQFTEFDISAGEGDDVVDISGLNDPSERLERPSDATYEDIFGPDAFEGSESMIRNVDGGAGFDVLKVGNGRNEYSNIDTHVMYSNFEAIIGNGENSGLILNNEMLTLNDAENETGFGLIISNAGT